MCHYITGAIPETISIEIINSVGKEFSLQFGICENSFVQRQLESGEQYIAKRSKYCDCGTPLGCLNHQRERTLRPEKSELDRLMKKGWSHAKIERFLAEKDKVTEKNSLKLKQDITYNTALIEVWTGFIRALLQGTKSKSFGLLLHWYSQTVHTENIRLKGRERIPITQLTDAVLLEMEEDVLYVIADGGGL